MSYVLPLAMIVIISVSLDLIIKHEVSPCGIAYIAGAIVGVAGCFIFKEFTK